MFPPRCSAVLFLLVAPLGLAQDTPAFPGSESTAPWRQEAEEKIAQLRKGDLSVTVQDASGAPIKDAAITLKQKRHEFPFSIVVDPAMFDPADEEDATARIYRDRVAALFDMPRVPESADTSETVRQWAKGVGLHDPASMPETPPVALSIDPASLPHPAEYIEQLVDESGSDLPLRLTGVELPVDPTSASALQLQAFYLRDLLTAAFAHSRITELEFAQLWSATATPARWTLYEHDWSPRPVAAMLEQLLRKTWWTEDGGLTNATGEWKIRAFLGDYRISASDGGRSKTISATLGASGTEVAIILQDDPPAPSPSPTSTPK